DQRADTSAVGVHHVEHHDLVLEQIVVEADSLSFVGGQDDVREVTSAHPLATRDRGREPAGLTGRSAAATARGGRAGQGEEAGKRKHRPSGRAGHVGSSYGLWLLSPTVAISHRSIIAWSSWMTL